MTDEDAGPPPEALGNSERLQQHLKEESLAARLVQTHRDSAGSIDALKAILTERLQQVRQNLGAEG